MYICTFGFALFHRTVLFISTPVTLSIHKSRSFCWGFFWVNPPKMLAINTQQKNTPKPIVLYSLVTRFKFKRPLIEHYSAFLDILKFWFPS